MICYPPQGDPDAVGATTYVGLTDTPGAITADGVAVGNPGGTAMIFVSQGAGGGLDADTVDGVQAAGFLLLAGRAGGQTAIGGTAAGEDLVLQSTSNATRGSILINAQGGNPLFEADEALDSGVGQVKMVNGEFNVHQSGISFGNPSPYSAAGTDRFHELYAEGNHAIDMFTFATNKVSTIELGRARGSIATPAAINNGDPIGAYQFLAHNGSTWGSRRCGVLGVGTISGANVGGYCTIHASANGDATSTVVAAFEKTLIDFATHFKVNVFTDATRGAPGTAGRIIFNSTDGNLNIDNGANWILPDGTVT